MIKLEWNPFTFFIEAFSKKFPDIKCDITLRGSPEDFERENALAFTIWPDDGSEPFISIDSQNKTLMQIFDLLGHELAHVIAGNNDESDSHGPSWKMAYDAIHTNFMEESLKEAEDNENLTTRDAKEGGC